MSKEISRMSDSLYFLYILVQSRKLQERGWKPRWFQREGEDGPFRYGGGYWEAREQGNWEGCPNIFGEFSKDIAQSSEES
ncbi:hypothetical protein MANES_01G057000v8 [Manihot esculenta]|uniref:Uncharacterized protein n=1 Tax=Manihot esculenta TaxID=3983 RepID=A0A2C9WHZ8_MANES|nr:hypothetical protein MANES_01G057000v8 [Manihot esculenta]